MTEINYYKQQYSDCTTEYLLDLRARGDSMVPNAQLAIGELLSERGEVGVPEASVIAPVAPRVVVLQMSAADAKKKAEAWKMVPLHFLGGALAALGFMMHGSSDTFPFLPLVTYPLGGLVGLYSSMIVVEYIYRTRATPWHWLLGLVPIYFVAYFVLIAVLKMLGPRPTSTLSAQFSALGVCVTLGVCVIVLPAIRRYIRALGLPPLLLAAGRGDTEGMRAALDNGDVVDMQDDEGQTALSYAALNNQKSAVRWLLDHGADPLICNQRGRSPADIAEGKGFHEVARIIREGIQSDASVTK